MSIHTNCLLKIDFYHVIYSQYYSSLLLATERQKLKRWTSLLMIRLYPHFEISNICLQFKDINHNLMS
jgi:hypothetical protein